MLCPITRLTSAHMHHQTKVMVSEPTIHDRRHRA
jgi:hypothetical protein